MRKIILLALCVMCTVSGFSQKRCGRKYKPEHIFMCVSTANEADSVRVFIKSNEVLPLEPRFFELRNKGVVTLKVNNSTFDIDLSKKSRAALGEGDCLEVSVDINPSAKPNDHIMYVHKGRSIYEFDNCNSDVCHKINLEYPQLIIYKDEKGDVEKVTVTGNPIFLKYIKQKYTVNSK